MKYIVGVRVLFLIFFLGLFNNVKSSEAINFNSNWEFVKDVDTSIVSLLFQKGDSLFDWEEISLPHTAHIEPLVIEGDQWQGYCFYRKFFEIPGNIKNKHIAIRFDGIMQEAEVWLNGKYIDTHIGGYLPFYVDVSDDVIKGLNCIVVRVNNNDNNSFAPGKTIKTLDFCYYSGIYRDATLFVKDRVYVPDPVWVNRVAGGGVFFKTLFASSEKASVELMVDINNDDKKDAKVNVEVELIDTAGIVVAHNISEKIELNSGSYKQYVKLLNISEPNLWSPDSPYLYTIKIKVLKGKSVIEKQSLKVGIRTFSVSAKEGFVLNGQKVYLRGTNRHQEYPYIGNALSNNAQYRDAWKIKMAGFNFVRLSHYPQSTAFLNACDELGIVVMNCIPGWQFFGGAEFQANALQDIRDMVRRDRNHASVMFWEASLNESRMSKDWMDKAHFVVKEELPETENYTCGWIDYAYDIYTPARQHGKAPDYWKKYKKDKPIFIAEYGDWEYYAQNAGFNQTAFADLQKEERTSRQLRENGQKRLAQQALNYQESHNDNLYGVSIGDANWLMFDYNRGYANDIESSGVMDIFRLPKFAFYFYESQKKPILNTSFNHPMLFIANYWNDTSYTDVKVYSNCDEVELYLNNKLVSRKKPDRDRNCVNLSHPPFTFKLIEFEKGTITAKGYLDGVMVSELSESTEDKPFSIKLVPDISGKKLEAGCNDVIFIYANIVDSDGNICQTSDLNISFNVEGDAELIGFNPIKSEAGIATILLKAGKTSGQIIVSAHNPTLKSSTLILNSSEVKR
ncbi:MAG: DUF4982 domain-containing protein [Marinilabiliaceae bacterium]|nr:DUF4982 domain-containing protein [Marinilabiliaceae bacterium]